MRSRGSRVPDPAQSVFDILAAMCREIPDAVVEVDPSGPDGWCRVRVGFSNGSGVFIGTAAR